MYQQHQGTQSTNQTTVTQKEEYMTPVPQTKTNDKIHHVYMTITNYFGNSYSDHTYRFPVISRQGNWDVVIFYTVYGNHIESYTIKSRHRNEVLKAYEEVYSYLRVSGYCPQLHHLDNETSRGTEISSLKSKLACSSIHQTCIKLTFCTNLTFWMYLVCLILLLRNYPSRCKCNILQC